MRTASRFSRQARSGRRRASPRGMTLIELMIALVIVGILTAVALPLYTRYQQRSYAAQAQADLGVCAQAMERHYTVNFRYEDAADDGGGGTANTGAPLGTVCPSASPPRGNALFNITIAAADANSYTLRATPVGGGPAAEVGLLEIDATGLRRWDKNNDGDTNDAGEDNWDI